MPFSRKDEQTVISALITLFGSHDDQQKERGCKLLEELTHILDPESFNERLFGDIYDTFWGDFELGLIPDYECTIGQLKMDGDFPDGSEDKIRGALLSRPLDVDAGEVLEAAKRIKEGK